jgi:hypothetical protein
VPLKKIRIRIFTHKVTKENHEVCAQTECANYFMRTKLVQMSGLLIKAILREPLIKFTMSHVAKINGMIARRTTQVVVAHGLVTGAASRLRVVRQGHLFRTCATRYRVEVATLRYQGVQHSERPFMWQPSWARVLRALCGVRLLVKGMTINFVAFLASHPVKPRARPCGT